MYTSSDNIDEKISIHRPTYDKIGLGYLLGQLAKKSFERKEPCLTWLDLNKIESSQSIVVPKEKDSLKDRYEDAKVYIGKLKDKIDDLKAKKSSEKTSSNDDIEDLKKENEILKHELKIVELKLSLKRNGSKIVLIENLRMQTLDLS